MKFQCGELVRIKSAFDEDLLCPPVAIIISRYTINPLILKTNCQTGMNWISQCIRSSPNLYDIIIEGRVERQVPEEWIARNPTS